MDAPSARLLATQIGAIPRDYRHKGYRHFFDIVGGVPSMPLFLARPALAAGCRLW